MNTVAGSKLSIMHAVQLVVGLVFILLLDIHQVMLTLMNTYATLPLRVMFYIVVVGHGMLHVRQYTNVWVYII
jgi:hypothetical protein